ncbi:uncharacterized protein LOC144506486 [Mustelus asterias]
MMLATLLLFAACVAVGSKRLQSPPALWLQEGQIAHFKCILQDEGKAVNGSIYWHYVKVIFGDTHVRNISAELEDDRIIVSRVNITYFYSKLRIKDLHISDTGMYYCNILIHKGSLSRKIMGSGSHLIVQVAARKNQNYEEPMTILNNLQSVVRYILFVLLMCYFILVETFY